MEAKTEIRKHTHTHNGETPVRVVDSSAADASSVDVCNIRDCRITAMDFK
jgi:hypothetical protein